MKITAKTKTTTVIEGIDIHLTVEEAEMLHDIIGNISHDTTLHPKTEFLTRIYTGLVNSGIPSTVTGINRKRHFYFERLPILKEVQ
jgi:hypothetical protein